MLIIHSTNCKACKALRPKLTNSEDVKRLSKKLIMVNSENNSDALAESIKPDGGSYYPR